MDCLPIYARDGLKEGETEFPDWKKYYIRANRLFYKNNKKWIDKWLPKISAFENSHQKFEWNCGDKVPLIINDKIVQDHQAFGLRCLLILLHWY